MTRAPTDNASSRPEPDTPVASTDATGGLDLDALERVARAAAEHLPGEWRTNEEPGQVEFLDEHAGEKYWLAFAHCSGGCLEWVHGSDHIATFDPPTVLAMIAKLRDQRPDDEGSREAHPIAVSPVVRRVDPLLMAEFKARVRRRFPDALAKARQALSALTDEGENHE